MLLGYTEKYEKLIIEYEESIVNAKDWLKKNDSPVVNWSVGYWQGVKDATIGFLEDLKRLEKE